MRVVLVLIGLLALGVPAQADVTYTSAHPLSSVITTPVKDCGKFMELPVAMLAWVGDMPTIYANGSTETTSPGSIFAKEKLSVRLYRQDSLVKQVEDFLSCKTPILRLTNGMAVMAMDALNADPRGRTKPRPFYLLTWSDGGDVAVGLNVIKEPKDMCDMDGSLQEYGPHVEYMATTFRSAGCRIPVEKIHWVKDMIEENKDSMYPARALREDSKIKWVFTISPDANDLTHGQKTPGIGDGGELSVKGAHKIFSTQSCNTCIPDEYYVRNDWYEASQENRDMVFRFVHGLLLAQQESAKLMAEKQPQKVYDAWILASAKMLLGSADLTASAEGMWGDARFAGLQGNIDFFTDAANPRNLAKLVSEAGEAFGPKGLKLIANAASMTPVPLDYRKLSEGLTVSGAEAPRFNKQVLELVQARAQQGTLDEDRLFYFNVQFEPNKTAFNPKSYEDKFDQMIELMATFGGAIYSIEVYADTQKYLLLKCGTVVDTTGKPKLDMNCKSGTGSPALLASIKQTLQNDTLTRGKAVRDALIAYAKEKRGVTLNGDKIEIVGHGLMKPNVTGCKYDKDGDITASCYPPSEEAWNAMRHAVFSVISTESNTFQALR